MIEVIELFPEINRELIELLESLTEEQWNKETCLKNRTVKDLASHIMDTSLRRLSMQRDGYIYHTPDIKSYGELIDFIQGLNRDWIEATKRLSPAIVIPMLKNSEKELYEFLKSLNPDEKSFLPVDWSGEEESKNWFDIAREYTEKWHHQMQIREALAMEGNLYTERLFQPVIDTFVRAIPFTYDKLEREGFSLNIEITGGCGGQYSIKKSNGKTEFVEKLESENRVTIDQQEFWRLVTNSKAKKDILYDKRGDSEITEHFLTVVAVMS